MNEEIIHKDCLGRVIKIGNCVAFSNSSHLVVGIVDKLNPKMVRVKLLGRPKWASTYNRYPADVAILEGPEVTLFLLKNSSER